MTKAVSIIEAMEDDQLFGGWLGPLDTWRPWIAILRGTFGLPMNEAEAGIFAKLTQRKPPTRPARELWICAGRRSGKSSATAMLATYFAAFKDYSDVLRRGEVATIPVLAADRAQARTIFRYTRALLDVPMFRDLIVSETKDTISLSTGVCIEIGTASHRSLRGYSVPLACCDEVAHWRVDEGSASRDTEILASLRPAQVTFPQPLLVAISTPYARRGAMWEAYRAHFGQDDSDVLIVQATTRDLNGTVSQAEIDEAVKRDPAHAGAEFYARFRVDIESFLDDSLIDAAIDRDRPLELPPRDGVDYQGFVDASGGRHDSFCVAIGHREGDQIIIDLVRGRKPPFSPDSVVSEYAELLKNYGLTAVTGDSYSAEWVVEAFRKHGIEYRSAKKPKSQLYLECLPEFAQGRLRVPNHKTLIRELRLLERRVHRSGRDTVDHGPAGSDDHSNSVAGAMWALRERPPREIRARIWGGPAEDAGQRLSVGHGLSPYTGSTSFDTWARGG